MFDALIRRKMAAEADQQIDKALIAGAPMMITPPRTEAGFVAALTLGAMPRIGSLWSRRYRQRGLTFELRSVFCHQSPMVLYGPCASRARCELADLLVVVDRNDQGLPWSRRASFIQVKMACRIDRVSFSGSSSKKQLALYQNWPLFDFEDPRIRLKRVDFRRGSDAFDSVSIGVIDRHILPSGSPPLLRQHAVLPTPRLAWNGLTLGRYLTRLVEGPHTGAGRVASRSLATPWSRTVQRLLEVTYNDVFHHRATLGEAAVPRGTSALTIAGPGLTYWLGENASVELRPPPPDTPGRVLRDGPIGISLIQVRISSTETPARSRGERLVARRG
jgi:hypothetical protein